MLFLYDVFQIFVGFVLGIYFERWNESRNDKKWSKKALLSILHDIDSSANAFKDVIEIDSYTIEDSILDEIDQIAATENYEFIDVSVNETIVDDNKIDFVFKIKEGER